MSSADDPLAGADRLLAALDFAGMAAAQEEKHRREQAELLAGFLDVADALQALERHCQELVRAGHAAAPARTAGVIHRQLLSVLARAGVEPLPAVGGPLDLDRHEVVAVRDDPDAAEDTVLEEITRGFVFRNQLLRRARVVVSRPGGDPAPPPGRDREDQP